MEYHAGIDVSLELSSICVVDATGKIIKEARVTSDPAALVAFFDGLGFAVTRIGLEAGPLSQWLHTGLTRGGFETVLGPEALGNGGRQTAWRKAGDGRSRAQDRSGVASNVGRRHDFPLDEGGACRRSGLSKEES